MAVDANVLIFERIKEELKMKKIILLLLIVVILNQKLQLLMQI